jgi:hypothetical protein
MNLTIDFSNQMLARITVYDGKECLISVYQKTVFDDLLAWTGNTASIGPGDRLTLNGREFEITGFQLISHKFADPKTSLEGIDSNRMGRGFEYNLILQINVRQAV